MTTQAIKTAQANVPPVAAAARSAGKARFLYLDNLRMAVITLVVVMHVAIMYGSEGNWYYYEAGETNTLAFVIMALLGGIGTAFTMGLLFLVAGYFTPRAYDRKGAGHFLVDRFKRLGLPLLFYGVVILPVISYLLDLQEGYQGSLEQWLVDYFRGVQSLADGPVWFLMELLIFSIGYALWRLMADRARKDAPLDRSGETNPPGNWAIAAFALGIGVVTFVVRIWAVVGVYYEPWHLEPAHAPQYIALFVVGTMAYRGNWLGKFSEAQARPWRWIALFFILLMPALVVAAGALSGQLDPQGAGGLNWLSLAYSLWEGFMCVSLVIVVLAWFRKRFNHQGRLAKLMSDNCFAVYVLHPIVIVPLALALSGVVLNLSLKFVLVAPVAVALCYLLAYLIRKIPFVRSVL
jgi:surface polysaccharide O-acyltransferase-like enzyme